MLYIPVFVVAVVVWALVPRGLRRYRASPALMLASGACWTVSQGFETLQWEDDGPAAGYTWVMFCEEVLEMTGSTLLLLALLLAVRTERAEP